ncbi:hypothetical protein BDZ97DRAFT_1752467 [Flammula alnicola]|nr:hypothetical protein BDZ97DRAFT_1752467 [Flammula alnicola]
MPPRSETLPGGIVRLTKLLAHLNSPPKLALAGVKSLRMSLASQNDDFGARHFVDTDLPRIRYANPNLDIQVQQVKKGQHDIWRPEMELELENGTVQKLDLQDKWSTTILKELMEVAGGDPWKRHVAESKSAGMPLLPGEHLHQAEERRLKVRKWKRGEVKVLPTLQEHLKMQAEEGKAKIGPKKDPKGVKISPPPPATESTTEATS